MPILFVCLDFVLIVEFYFILLFMHCIVNQPRWSYPMPTN